MKGLLTMLEQPRNIEVIRGHTVRFNMDSKSAIGNLVHSGPVRSLTPLTQQAWKLFEEYQINPKFRWVRRDTDILKRVDVLSKKVYFFTTGRRSRETSQWSQM